MSEQLPTPSTNQPESQADIKMFGVQNTESIAVPLPELTFEEMKKQIHEEFKIDDTGDPSTIYLTEAPSSWEGAYGAGPVKIDLGNLIHQNAPDLSGIEQNLVSYPTQTTEQNRTTPEASQKSAERKKSPLKWVKRVATAAMINFQVAREVGFGNYAKESLNSGHDDLKARYETARVSLGDKLILKQRGLNEKRTVALERKKVRTDHANRLKELQKELVKTKIEGMNAKITERQREEITRKLSRSGLSGYWI